MDEEEGSKKKIEPSPFTMAPPPLRGGGWGHPHPAPPPSEGEGEGGGVLYLRVKWTKKKVQR